MTRGRTDTRIVLLGNALVLALVVALPLCLALLPTETLQCEPCTGDLSAAALSSLDRDIQTARLLSPHHVRVLQAGFLSLPALLGEQDAGTAQDLPTRDPAPPGPGTCTPGPTDATHCLLL